jgi:hypothetical protein
MTSVRQGIAIGCSSISAIATADEQKLAFFILSSATIFQLAYRQAGRLTLL